MLEPRVFGCYFNLMNKKEMRKEFLQARRALDPEQARSFSVYIIERLRGLPKFLSSDCFLIYVASKDNEVDTRPLIEDLIQSGRKVFVPIAEPGGHLAWSRLLDMGELVPARFGILEPGPEARRISEPPGDALVVVPGVAFTREGWRIGYGGGYFDRFLAHHAGVKAAVAYELQLADEIEHEAHDVPMDVVVTETRVYKCGVRSLESGM